MGRDSLVAYKSSDPEIKEISKRSSGEAETVDIDLNINVNDNDEERINQPDLKKARTVDEDPATTEVSQGILETTVLLLNLIDIILFYTFIIL